MASLVPATAASSTAADSDTQPSSGSRTEFVAGELAVTMRSDGAGGSAAGVLAGQVTVLTERKITSMHPGVTVAASDVDDAIAALAADPHVAAVEQVPRMRIQAPFSAGAHEPLLMFPQGGLPAVLGAFCDVLS